ncbi:hypothetical protein BDW22DRAFT_1326561 [Trametopsis cervina]|nr:hypothetical protein BDW22DRAFT_1326561 [Trametopsis cervina]
MVRYAAAGLVILLYDYVLMFGDEVHLVWGAPRSFAKYAYLFNRYLVMVCMLVVTHEMCGFAMESYSDATALLCQRLLFSISCLSLISIGLGNVLVLLRVVLLWDHRPIIFRLMTGGFLISFSIQAALMIITLMEMIPGVHWAPAPLSMCVTTTNSPKLIGVWACPMLFEVLVLFSTVLNAFDRPHQAEVPVAKALYRDGIIYFCAVTCFRTLNLVFATLGRPSTTMLMVFFAWAATTTVLSRALLHIRKKELMSDRYTISGRASPFNMISSDLHVMDAEASWLHLGTMRSNSR